MTRLREDTDTVTAVAPASVGNVAVGFDILGLALSGLVDRVTIRRSQQPGAHLGQVSGEPRLTTADPDRNTAVVAARAMADAMTLPGGFRIDIHKGIPLAAGLGGSAASAVAAVVALNGWLEDPLPVTGLYDYALTGEAAASGARHGDNVSASLLGGLVLIAPGEQLIALPTPENIHCAAVWPALKVETQSARGLLSAQLAVADHIRQQASLAGFVHALHRADVNLLRRCLEDHIVEPQRHHLVTGFDQVKAAAMDSGAIGASLSGSGPTVFAWFDGRDAAEAGAGAMTAAFRQAGVAAQYWISPLNAPGARIES